MVEKGPVMTAQRAFRSRTTTVRLTMVVAAHKLASLRLVLTYHNQGWLADNHQRGCLVPYLPLVSRQRSTMVGSALEGPTYRTVGCRLAEAIRLTPGSSCEPTGGGPYRGPPWALPQFRNHFRYCSPFVGIWILFTRASCLLGLLLFFLVPSSAFCDRRFFFFYVFLPA